MGIWIPGGMPGGDAPTPTPTPTIVSWANGTDVEIAAMLKAHYDGLIDIHDYWSVGDKRNVTLSAMPALNIGESHTSQTVTYVLSNVGGQYLADGEGTIECAFQVDQVNCLNETGYMHNSTSGTGAYQWMSCLRRFWCNTIYRDSIPSTLRNIFKSFYNSTSSIIDYFALRNEPEIFGSSRYSGTTGTQITWYATSSNRIKKVNNSNAAWWQRSGYYTGTTYSSRKYYFCYVSNSGSDSYTTATTNYGIAPFGVI